MDKDVSNPEQSPRGGALNIRYSWDRRKALESTWAVRTVVGSRKLGARTCVIGRQRATGPPFEEGPNVGARAPLPSVCLDTRETTSQFDLPWSRADWLKFKEEFSRVPTRAIGGTLCEAIFSLASALYLCALSEKRFKVLYCILLQLERPSKHKAYSGNWISEHLSFLLLCLHTPVFPYIELFRTF